MHRRTCWLQVSTWVEGTFVFGQKFADRTGDGHATIGVDIDLANTALDATLNFFHWHAISLLHLTTKLIDDVLQLLWHAAAAVHNQVSVWQLGMNRVDTVHRQDFAGRFLGELVCTMAGSDRNCQCVNASFGDETLGFFRIGKQLIVC